MVMAAAGEAGYVGRNIRGTAPKCWLLSGLEKWCQIRPKIQEDDDKGLRAAGPVAARVVILLRDADRPFPKVGMYVQEASRRRMHDPYARY